MSILMAKPAQKYDASKARSKITTDLALDAERSAQTSEWYRQRTETVKANITAHDVLRHFGGTLKQSGSTSEEQIPCPFHGQDNHYSARIYPESPGSTSHVWCWTCQKNWDNIALYKEFQGDPEMKFSQALSGLERLFGITPPEAPDWSKFSKGPSDAEEEVERLLEVAESRLKMAKPYFEKVGHLRVGQVLDKIRYRLEKQMLTSAEALPVLKQVLDKIGEKVRGKTL